MRIKVPKALPYRYADLVVICEEPAIENIQGQEMLVNPLLIVEVLSPTTEGYDYGVKFTAYQSIASFREYLLVSQDRPHLTHYVRQAESQWLRHDVQGLDSTLKLATINCKLEFNDIYRLVEFPASENV
jgi:Uma2 family endonuclease